jgi:hypothetical protein
VSHRQKSSTILSSSWGVQQCLFRSKKAIFNNYQSNQSSKSQFSNLRIFIAGHVSSNRVPPNTRRQFDILGTPVHPGINCSLLLKRVSQQAGIATKTRNISGHGGRRKNDSIGSLQNRSLSSGRLGSNGGFDAFGIYVDIDAIVFSGDQGSKGTERSSRRVEGVSRRHGDKVLKLIRCSSIFSLRGSWQVGRSFGYSVRARSCSRPCFLGISENENRWTTDFEYPLSSSLSIIRSLQGTFRSFMTENDLVFRKRSFQVEVRQQLRTDEMKAENLFFKEKKAMLSISSLTVDKHPSA